MTANIMPKRSCSTRGSPGVSFLARSSASNAAPRPPGPPPGHSERRPGHSDRCARPSARCRRASRAARSAVRRRDALVAHGLEPPLVRDDGVPRSGYVARAEHDPADDQDLHDLGRPEPRRLAHGGEQRGSAERGPLLVLEPLGGAKRLPDRGLEPLVVEPALPDAHVLRLEELGALERRGLAVLASATRPAIHLFLELRPGGRNGGPERARPAARPRR